MAVQQGQRHLRVIKKRFRNLVTATRKDIPSEIAEILSEYCHPLELSIAFRVELEPSFKLAKHSKSMSRDSVHVMNFDDCSDLMDVDLWNSENRTANQKRKESQSDIQMRKDNELTARFEGSIRADWVIPTECRISERSPPIEIRRVRSHSSSSARRIEKARGPDRYLFNRTKILEVYFAMGFKIILLA